MKARTKQDMRRWLRRFSAHDPLARIVLKYGQWFIGRANVLDHPVALAWKMKRRPRAQRCFYNAQQFCIDHPEGKYWEGYFLIGGMPMEHAWVGLNGLVFDFTLEAVLRKAKREGGVVDDRPPLYLGLHVPRQSVLKLYAKRHPAGPIAASLYDA